MSNTKADFAVQLLRMYADECSTMVRSTSDLSPLEEWLIIRLRNLQQTPVSGSLPLDKTDRVQQIVNRAVLETGLSEDEVIGYMLYVLKGKEIRAFGGNDR